MKRDIVLNMVVTWKHLLVVGLMVLAESLFLVIIVLSVKQRKPPNKA